MYQRIVACFVGPGCTGEKSLPAKIYRKYICVRLLTKGKCIFKVERRLNSSDCSRVLEFQSERGIRTNAAGDASAFLLVPVIVIIITR